MAKTVYQSMKLDSRPLATVFEEVCSVADLDCIEVIGHEANGVQLLTAVFERGYLRTGGVATVTLSLIQVGETLLADVIGAGGGEGVFNVSLGANADIARLAQTALEQVGFEEK